MAQHCEGLEGQALRDCQAAQRADITARVRQAASPPLRKVPGVVERAPQRTLRADPATAQDRIDFGTIPATEPGTPRRPTDTASPVGNLAARVTNSLTSAREKITSTLVNVKDIIVSGLTGAKDLGDRFINSALTVLEDSAARATSQGVAIVDRGATQDNPFPELNQFDLDKVVKAGVELPADAAQVGVGLLEGAYVRAIQTPATVLDIAGEGLVNKVLDPFRHASIRADFQMDGMSPLQANAAASAQLTREKMEVQDARDRSHSIVAEVFQTFAETLPGDPDGLARTGGRITGGLIGDFSFYLGSGAILGKVMQARALSAGTTSLWGAPQASRANIFRRNVAAGLPGDAFMGAAKETSFAQFLADETDNPLFSAISDNAAARMLMEVTLGFGTEFGLSRAMKGWVTKEITLAKRLRRQKIVNHVSDMRHLNASSFRMIVDARRSLAHGAPLRTSLDVNGHVTTEAVSFNEQQVYDARTQRARAELEGTTDQLDPRINPLADVVLPHEIPLMNPKDKEAYLKRQTEADTPERVAHYPDGSPGRAYVAGAVDDGPAGVTVSKSAWEDGDRLLEEQARAQGSRTLVDAPRLLPHADAEAAVKALDNVEGITGVGVRTKPQTVVHNVGTPDEFNITTFRIGSHEFKVSVEGRTISLSQVKRARGAPPRQGTKAMKRFLKVADEHNVLVTLEAVPIGANKGVERGLVGKPQDTLVEWYESLGFDQVQKGGPGTAVVMARQPQGYGQPMKGYMTTRGNVVSRAEGVRLEMQARQIETRAGVGVGGGHPTARSLHRPDVVARHGTPAGRSLVDAPKNLHELEALHAGKILDDKSGLGPTRAFLQKWLHSEQLLPKGLFDAHGRLRGRLGKLERLVTSTSVQFKRAFSGSKFTDEQVNAMMSGRRHMQDLTRDQTRVLKKMRSEIDAFSREAIKQGVVDGDLAVAFTENLGTYLTRSYRIFKEPDKWPKIVRRKYPERISQAKDWMRKQNPDLSEADLDDWIGDVLYAGVDSGSPIDVLRRGQLPGMSDMSSLRKRGNVPKVIRELWGEETDPVVNFLRSSTKLFHMIENHRFLTQVNLRGQGQVFFAESTGDFRHQIKVTHPALKPLEDMWTTPEIAEALRNITGYDARAFDNLFGNAYRAVNQAAKWGKTVGSQQGHIRNIMAWAPLWLAQGHTFGAARKLRVGLDIIPILRGRWGGGSREAWDQYVQRLAELRVIGEVPIAGELRRLSNQVISSDNPFSPVALQEATGIGKIIPALNNAYRAGDDFGKIIMFEAERARYLPALQIKQGNRTVTSVDGIHPATEAEIDEFIATITRGTSPNYSGLPRVVTDIISHVPVGDFVAFPTEMIRVLGFTLKQIETEVFHVNPMIRKIGAQRLRGLMGAATATGAASIASAYLYGYSPEERDAIRRNVPPWSRNAEFIYLPRDDAGNIRYIDMSYTDPFSHGKEVVIGWLRGEDMSESLVNAGLALLEPYINPEMTVGLMSDINRNENQRIYFDGDSPAVKAMKSVAYVAREGIMPATISQYQKILDGQINTEAKLWGPQYDPMTEAIAAFSGVRITEMDPVRTFTFSVNTYANDVDANLGVVRSVMTRPGQVTERQIRNAYEKMEGRREELFLGMEQSFFDAKVLGVSEDAVFQILESKTNPQLASDLDFGIYLPWVPSAIFLEGTKNAIASQVESPDEVLDEFERRLEILERVAIEYERLHIPRALRRRGN